MSSRSSRSVSSTRSFEDIIGTIIGNGSGEPEEKTAASVSLVKQKFRERRRQNSPGGSIGSHNTDEERQNPPSPIRQYNETRARSSSRPPTPDRIRGNNKPPTPDRNKNRRSFFDDDSPSEPAKVKSKGISLRSLSISSQKRRSKTADSKCSPQSLTNRVRTQVKKTMNNTTKGENQTAGTTTFGPSEQTQKQKVSQANTKSTQELNRIGKTSDPNQPGLSTKIGKNAGTTASYSVEDMDKMKDIIRAQSEQIKFFEDCLMKRSNNIEQLSLDLKLSKKTESRLTLELELHDLKYSMFDDYRRTMDRERLKGKSTNDDSDEGEDPSTSLFTNSNAAFIKLDQLDRLYEQSKLEADSRFSILQDEYNRISSAKSIYDDEASIDSKDAMPTSMDLLQKRIKILEAENWKYSCDIGELRAELKSIQKSPNDSTLSKKEENRFYAHNLEKQALQDKIVALETEIGFTSGHVDDRTRTRRYRSLEKNLDDYVTEIMGLEDQLREKDKIILKLKARNIEMNTGSDNRNNMGSNWAKPAEKWYEKAQNRQTGQVVFEGIEIETTKSWEVASTAIIDNTSSTNGLIRNQNLSIKRGVNRRRASDSTSRIAMLRKRLDALASDHYSVGTEDTQRSINTTPY